MTRAVRTIATVVVALMLAAAGNSAAAEKPRTVQVAASSARTLVLDDGTQLWLTEAVNVRDLREGVKVMLTYEEQGGRHIVTSIEAAE